MLHLAESHSIEERASTTVAATTTSASAGSSTSTRLAHKIIDLRLGHPKRDTIQQHQLVTGRAISARAISSAIGIAISYGRIGSLIHTDAFEQNFAERRARVLLEALSTFGRLPATLAL